MLHIKIDEELSHEEFTALTGVEAEALTSALSTVARLIRTARNRVPTSREPVEQPDVYVPQVYVGDKRVKMINPDVYQADEFTIVRQPEGGWSIKVGDIMVTSGMSLRTAVAEITRLMDQRGQN